MFAFARLADEFIVGLVAQAPGVLYGVVRAALFVGAWTSDARSMRYFERPFLRVSAHSNTHYVWYLNGKTHRSGGKVAAWTARVCAAWYENDVPHRLHDKPAVVWKDGSKFWYVRGKRHRDDDTKPAAVRPNGTTEWYRNGKLYKAMAMNGGVVEYGYHEVRYVTKSSFMTRAEVDAVLLLS